MESSVIPLELYRPIFEKLVMQQWVSQSLKGRLVNQFFNKEVLRALLKTKDERAADSIDYKILELPLLVSAVTDPKDQHKPICLSVRAIVDWVFSSGSLRPKCSRSDYAIALSYAFVSSMPEVSTFFFFESWESVWVTKENRGKVALVAAAISNDCDLITQLLQIGANLQTNPLDIEPLPAACARGNSDAAKILLQHAEKLDRWCDLGQALIRAAREGWGMIVDTLTEASFIHHYSYQDLKTAVLLATLQGRYSIVKHLGNVQNLRSNHGLKQEVLHTASRYGREQIVQLVMHEWGLDLEARESVAWMAYLLSEASQQGHTNVVKFLLSQGANCSCKDGIQRALCSAASEGHEDTATVLINAGANVDCGQHSSCPFITAAGNSQIHFLRFLIKHGSNLKHLNCAGDVCTEIALEGAAGNGREAVVRFLVSELSIRPECDPMNPRHNNPMLAAMSYGQPQVVSVLLELGFKPIDHSKTYCADHFECGAYPMGPWPMTCVKRVLDRATGATVQIWAHRE